jgi:hypothetical protein
MSFKRLDPEDISISADSVVAPAWTGQLTTLANSNIFTSSQDNITTGNYYYNIYNLDPITNSSTAVKQLSIAYGNYLGSGSTALNSNVSSSTPSSINYGQYRTLVNGDENTNFTFGTVIPKSIFIITVNRSRYKEKLLPGSFNLTLTSGSVPLTLRLTDNSKTVSTVSYVDSGRVYDIVSGSNGIPYTGLTTTGFTPASGSYGKFLPDIGTIILNGDALSGSLAAGGLSMFINQNNGVDTRLNLSAMYDVIKTGGNFKLQSEETVSSNYVFVRVRNGEYNYSTNPSNITGSGELRYNVMINSPQAYLTTVGLYNDNNDLLAVAKLSKPLLKDFTKEALVRIKLDY